MLLVRSTRYAICHLHSPACSLIPSSIPNCIVSALNCQSDSINTLAAECRLAQQGLRRAIEVDGRVSEEKLLSDTLAAMDRVSEALTKFESLRLKEGGGNAARDG